MIVLWVNVISPQGEVNFDQGKFPKKAVLGLEKNRLASNHSPILRWMASRLCVTGRGWRLRHG